jgi:hypothetical protein
LQSRPGREREGMVGWIGEEKKKEIFLFMIFDSRNCKRIQKDLG